MHSSNVDKMKSTFPFYTAMEAAALEMLGINKE